MTYEEHLEQARRLGTTPTVDSQEEWNILQADLLTRFEEQHMALIEYCNENDLPVAAELVDSTSALARIGLPPTASHLLTIIIGEQGMSHPQNVVWLAPDEPVSETSATRFYETRPHLGGSRYPNNDPLERNNKRAEKRDANHGRQFNAAADGTPANNRSVKKYDQRQARKLGRRP